MTPGGRENARWWSARVLWIPVPAWLVIGIGVLLYILFFPAKIR